jgi:hypothetical protein
MLERRRRRRGASWVPAAAPVGWSSGPGHAAQWQPARLRGVGAGRPALPEPAFSACLAETLTPPPPSDPTLGLHGPGLASPAGGTLFAAAVTPASPASGPRDADSLPEGPDLPLTQSAWIIPLQPPIFSQLPLLVLKACVKASRMPGCSLSEASWEPRRPLPRAQTAWAKNPRVTLSICAGG